MPEAAKIAAPGRFVTAYTRFRTKVWLYVLFAICIVWVAWNLTPFLPHFDDAGFERLNLFLSLESSITVSILLMWQDRQEAIERERMQQMLLLMESVRDMMLAQHEILVKLKAGNVK